MHVCKLLAGWMSRLGEMLFLFFTAQDVQNHFLDLVFVVLMENLTALLQQNEH